MGETWRPDLGEDDAVVIWAGDDDMTDAQLEVAREVSYALDEYAEDTARRELLRAGIEPCPYDVRRVADYAIRAAVMRNGVKDSNTKQ